MAIRNPEQLLPQGKEELFLPEHAGNPAQSAEKPKVANFAEFRNATRAKTEIRLELEKAMNSEARVRGFAKIMDKYGLDFLLSLFPELGDAASSAVSGLYLLFEAKKAGLDTKSYLKIIGLQLADIFVGVVPIGGDALDYLFKANKLSAEEFTKKKTEVITKAREMGMSETEIAQIEKDAKLLPQVGKQINASIDTIARLVGVESKVEMTKAA